MNSVKYLFGFLLIIISLTGCKETDWSKNYIDYEVDGPIVSVDLLKSKYQGSDLTIEEDFRLNGVVAMNAGAGNNFSKRYVFVHQYWKGNLRGIILDMAEDQAASLQPGDSIMVKIKNKIISRAEGPFMIKGIYLSDLYKIAQYKKVEARRVAINELKTNFSKYENTLVRVDATLNPLPVGGETLEGSKYLEDNSGGGMELYTSPIADFKDKGVPANASFEGMAFADKMSNQIRLMSYDGVQNGSGPIYAGWPEGFDIVNPGSKGQSYNSGTNLMYFKTGVWWCFQSIYGDNSGNTTPNRDVMVSPPHAIRMQQDLTVDAFLQMNFDVPNGATKVTFYYGSYYNDASCTFSLEASVDGGQSWTQVGNSISDARSFTTYGPSFASIPCDFDGPVRFRIKKFGLGKTVAPGVLNGRLGIDDFSVYQKY